VLAALLLAGAPPDAATAGGLDPGVAMQTSQAALRRVVGAHHLTSSDGRPFDTGTLRGRPVLVSYVFTSCAFVCPTLTTSLARGVAEARRILGDDAFAVVTVGFDTRVDTPPQMRRYAAERGIADANWHFLSGDEASVAALARDIGFAYTPAGGAWDHLAQVTVLDADGRVYQQVYGSELQVPMIVDPLKRLVLRQPAAVSDFLDRVRLLCTAYDPKAGRYRFDYSLILEIAIGVSCAILVLGFVVQAWRQGRPAQPARR
jgi:protein SCO1/2